MYDITEAKRLDDEGREWVEKCLYAAKFYAADRQYSLETASLRMAAYIERQAANLRDAVAEIERLREALRQSEAWFREYERSHRAKVRPSDDPFTQAAANDKADRNRDRADFCAHALGDTHDPD